LRHALDLTPMTLECIDLARNDRNVYGTCYHGNIRALAPCVRKLEETLLWCARCGAVKRYADGRWLRWMPPGMQRMAPAASSDRRQTILPFASGQPDTAMISGRGAHIAEVIPIDCRRR
jgi:hypothetical protein